MVVSSLIAPVPGMANGFQGGGDLTSMILMMVIIFGIFYFLVIRPQQQRQSEHEEMVENLSSGDRVVTVGGLHGKVTSVSEETFDLNIAKDIKVTVSRDKLARIKNGGDDE